MIRAEWPVQCVALRQVRNAAGQILSFQSLNILTIYQDRPVIGIGKMGHRAHQRRLACTVRPDKSDQAAGREFRADIMKHDTATQ